MDVNAGLLDCKLEIAPKAGGLVALSFDLTNRGDQPISIRYFSPFLSFELEAFAGNEPIELVQPAYDTGVQAVKASIAPGESYRIQTPIRLRFDPAIPPSGGNDPKVWTLKHDPVPVTLRVTLHIGELTIGPCEARFDPAK
ncbi:MAG: hypothetical protein EHM70_11645 [Chloroflexota bacterium]|nr:MAG: hypothetical protein EHM70_11645 [Chloroflexota bacterium]